MENNTERPASNPTSIRRTQCYTVWQLAARLWSTLWAVQVKHYYSENGGNTHSSIYVRGKQQNSTFTRHLLRSLWKSPHRCQTQIWSDLIFGMKDTLDHTFTIWPAHAPSSLTFNQGFTQIIYCSEGCVLHIYRNRRHLLCIQTRGNIISVTTTRANASLFNICILKRRLAKIRGLLWGKRVLHAICLPSLHKTKQLHKVRRHL